MSNQTQSAFRPLHAEEDSLVRALLTRVNAGGHLLQQLTGALVRNLDDGGMGSLEFTGNESRFLGRCVVEAEYVDCDGVRVSIVLNTDQDERLYELDMWKVNFAPLRTHPAPERVTIKA